MNVFQTFDAPRSRTICSACRILDYLPQHGVLPPRPVCRTQRSSGVPVYVSLAAVTDSPFCS